VLAAFIAVSRRAGAQQGERGELTVSATVVDVASIAGATSLREVGRATGATIYAGRLSLTGSTPVQVTVTLRADPGASVPALSVRRADGRLVPLVPGAAPVVVAERARPRAAPSVGVEYRVEARAVKRLERESLGLTYTVWYPGGP
jgi:hypothetical protein